MDIDIEESPFIAQQNIVETRRVYGYDYVEEVDEDNSLDITDSKSIGEIEMDEYDSEEESPDNLGDLQRLYHEATDMIQNNHQPTAEEWYNNRFKYIYKYSHLNWDELIYKFERKDVKMYELCSTTKSDIQDILDGYSGTPNFDFKLYYKIITNILTLWNYYSNKYIGNETDIDIIDLAQAMSFL